MLEDTCYINAVVQAFDEAGTTAADTFKICIEENPVGINKIDVV